jgi:hypothetical protein
MAVVNTVKNDSLPPDNPAKIIYFADIIESNGKTVYKNNMEKKHNVPIGTLVEVKYDRWHGDGACEKIHARLWVVSHDRDCDGTPLYSLSVYKEPMFVDGQIKYRDDDGWWLKKEITLNIVNEIRGGFSRELLTPVEMTKELKDGERSLRWDDEEK